jgi:circadian clock protein KaiB
MDSNRQKMEVLYELKLYIAGMSPNSIRAIENTKYICRKYIHDHYDLEVIDVYQQPHLAKELDLIALPVLRKKKPDPEEFILGDMSDTAKVLSFLNIKEYTDK